MSKKAKSLIILLCAVVLIGIVSIAVFFGLSKENTPNIDEKLDEIYISVSHNYVNSLFGEPKISIKENEILKSNFYLLDDVVLRTVTEDDSVVAFFITSMNEENKITVQSIDSKEIIGETNYLDTDFVNPTIDASFSGNGRYNYYAEIQGTGRYAMYNYYVFATLPYGFIDDESAELCREYGTEDTESITKDESLRNNATPNTFGIIADGYEEMVSMIPATDSWKDIFYLLTK